MRRSPIQRLIDRHLLLPNDINLHLRRALLPPCAPSAADTVRMRPRAEDRRFFECEFEAAEDDGVEGVGFDGGHDGDAVAGSVTVLGTVDGERDGVLGEVARFGLLVDGPGGVQFVFVDYDGGGGGVDDGFAASEEAPVCGFVCVSNNNCEGE